MTFSVAFPTNNTKGLQYNVILKIWPCVKLEGLMNTFLITRHILQKLNHSMHI